MKNNKSQLIHFIGIGGIGISALVKYFLSQGIAVRGSDLMSSEITDDLVMRGATVVIGPHKRFNVPAGVTRIIYTAAAADDNSELREARRRKIPTQTYAEALGEMTRTYKTITISGAHGKSTTTALAALVLEEGYYDPTVIVGTKLKEFGDSNFRRGYGPHLVLEADEWNKSFLNYSPEIAMVTTIDAEHLDTYKTSEEIEETFQEYLAKVPRHGIIIANKDDLRSRRVAKKFGQRVRWYSLKNSESAIVARVLKIPGTHNISNALAALTLGRSLGIRETHILHALSRFGGAWRRFELKGFFKGAACITDYGHHPTEIAATLAAARERFPFRRIWCVYQPHQRERLLHLWDNFVGAFDNADRVCLLPVYEPIGREMAKTSDDITSLKLTHALVRRGKQACHLDTFGAAKDYMAAEVHKGDAILIMGAGDIYRFANEMTGFSSI